MLVTDKFVFFHLPHTGGAFVHNAIRKAFPGARDIGNHLSRELLPDEFSSLPVLGAVTSPWDFYVSWYHDGRSHTKHSASQDILLARLSQGGTLSFAQTIQNTLELGVNDNKLDSLVRSLPEEINLQKVNTPLVTKALMRRMQGTGIGLYSFLFKHFFGNLNDVSFCRAESLVTDLLDFFERIGLLTPTLRASMIDLAKQTSAADGHYSTYYNPDLAALVSLRDRQLIERFGFAFEKAPSEQSAGTAQLRPAPRRAKGLERVLSTSNGSSYGSKQLFPTSTSGAKTTRPFNGTQAATRVRRPQLQDSPFFAQIASQARVIIIEGISGSGKDTLQMYLKQLLKDRDIHDYSEGELLHSWNQLQIKGIFEVRVKFMKLFVNYMKQVLSRDENALFILNRFHLSAYANTVMQEPKLQPEYNEMLSMLRTLPVHVLLLQLDENEIATRSLHSERPPAWQKFQEQIVEAEGFRNRVERYMWQQRLLLEAANKQNIPFHILKLPTQTESSVRGPYVSDNRRILGDPVPMIGAEDTCSVTQPTVTQTA
jgi:thymidylate kinase